MVLLEEVPKVPHPFFGDDIERGPWRRIQEAATKYFKRGFHLASVLTQMTESVEAGGLVGGSQVGWFGGLEGGLVGWRVGGWCWVAVDGGGCCLALLRSVLFAVLFPYVALGRPIVFMCVVIQTPKSRKRGDTVAIDETS